MGWVIEKIFGKHRLPRFRLQSQCLQTRLYYDIEDIDHFVILEHTKRILSAKDIERGYVNRRWIIEKFKHAIRPILFTKRSCLVEWFPRNHSWGQMCLNNAHLNPTASLQAASLQAASLRCRYVVHNGRVASGLDTYNRQLFANLVYVK